MKSKEVLALDLDSVLNNLNEVWIKIYNRDWNDNLTEADLKVWDMTKLVKPECGRKIYDYLKRPGFFSSKTMKPLPMAVEITQKLAEIYDIYVVTAYVPESCMDKCEFIDTYYPHIGSDRIIFCNHKQLIKADYLVDDGPHNHEHFEGVSIILDYPYSKDYYPDKLHAKNWEEIGRYLIV